MATATLITPAAHYQPQPQPPFSSYSQPSSGAASIANMISEPRKAADDQEPSNRQSLPSISEVIQGTKPGPYPVAHAPGLQSGSSLPSPFAPAPRSFPEAEKRSSPQPLHPTSSFPRQDGPAFADSPRPHFSNRPSLPPVSDRRQSPSAKADLPPHHHHHPEQKLPEPHHPLNGAYAHPPPPPPAPVAYQPGQLPLFSRSCRASIHYKVLSIEHFRSQVASFDIAVNGCNPVRGFLAPLVHSLSPHSKRYVPRPRPLDQSRGNRPP
ncbi:hypothetical protein FOC4_g10013783 [Fusarium odoratissimum]|uniref:Uncharacterized protein n=1 Tax=Fusarium oxysporum f. sp. cubense (strain race 4) TaxID=2502994 RepID=N1RD34_FUSC4|nr:hypothetical protein FOC4_g10013783 [Fusarium odoratissimum]